MTPSSPTSRSSHAGTGVERPDYSVIVPCYEEAATLPSFHSGLSEALDALPYSFEIIYVNDGSRDATLAGLQALFEADTRIKYLIDLAANSGQNNAQSAGIQFASGENLIFMDCDLQVDPKDLAPLIAAFESGCDLASGLRMQRQDAAFRRLFSELGNRFVSRVAGVRMRDLGSGLKIMRGSLIRAFTITPYQPLNPGAVILCLRSVVEVPVTHRARKYGGSRWTILRFVILYHNILMNLVPVLYPFAVGALIFVLTAFLGILTAAGLYPDLLPMAQNPVLPSVLITLHMIFTLGLLLIIGEFILRGRADARGPAYIIREVWTRSNAVSNPATETAAVPEP